MRTADRVRRDGIRVWNPERRRWQKEATDWMGMVTRARRDGTGGEKIPAAPQVVVADDVSAWQTEQHNEFSLDDLPPMRPPWADTWIEYPSGSGRERRAALMVTSDKIPTHLDVERLAATHGREPLSLLMAAADDAVANGTPRAAITHLVAIAVFAETRDGVFEMGMFHLALDGAGRPVGNRWQFTAPTEGMPEGAAPEGWLLAAVSTALWTCALLNMRNVTTEQISPPVLRRHRKRGNLPPVRYHVLRLRLPGGRTTGMDGRAPGETGIHPGLHIVRGHPAHYGDRCPGQHEPRKRLFGRHQGVYWIPAHMRGDPEQGTVEKDYEALVER